MLKKGLLILGCIFGGLMFLFVLFVVLICVTTPSSSTASTEITTEEVTTEKAKEEVTTEEVTTEDVSKKEYLKPNNDIYTVESGETSLYVYIDYQNDYLVAEFSMDVLGEDMSEEYVYIELYQGKEENSWVSKDNRFTVVVNSTESITVTDSSNNIYNYSADYHLYSMDFETPSEDTTVEFISDENFGAFVHDSNNIGKTIQFRATVYLTTVNEYMLMAGTNENNYILVTNITVNDPLLFDNDSVLITATYNGKTENGLYLSFSTVSIELAN